MGKASIRRRKLPAEHVVWLMIELALFSNQAIGDVVRQLNLTRHGQPMSVPRAVVVGRSDCVYRAALMDAREGSTHCGRAAEY